LGLTALAAGAGLDAARERYRALFAPWPAWLDGSAIYMKAFEGVQRLAYLQTHALQGGSLRRYLQVVLATGTLAAGALLVRAGLPAASGWTDLRFHEALLVAVIVAAAGTAIMLR